ncbi:hypothetical protein [Streptomyces sp. SCL15-4]|uniref:hypothetical protein n=1 Tax=Streptomyces sp. SCL15-4 TaxID=2967221 RepID=UPI002965E44B|nr:hypothetical protein [Streptomyces sp. SCL15-4]
MGFGQIVAHQIQQLAGQVSAGVLDSAAARKAAEDNLARLSPADRREAEAILRQTAPRR